MLVRIGKIRYINIYSNHDGAYIVHNTKKEFKCGHTHINNYKTAQYIAKLAAYHKLPKNDHLSNYLFESLIRISDDNTYINQIKLLQMKMNNKQKKKK